MESKPEQADQVPDHRQSDWCALESIFNQLEQNATSYKGGQSISIPNIRSPVNRIQLERAVPSDGCAIQIASLPDSWRSCGNRDQSLGTRIQSI